MEAVNTFVPLLNLYKVQAGIAAVTVTSLAAVYLSGMHSHLSFYIGDPNTRRAVLKNQQCEQSYQASGATSEAYLRCRTDLEDIVRGLLHEELFTPDDCETIHGRPEAVLCRIYSYLVPYKIVVTEELVVTAVRSRNSSDVERVREFSVAVDGKKRVEASVYKNNLASAK